MKTLILIIWLILSFFLDVFLVGGTTYLVFWKGLSGWLFIPAIILSHQPILYKILKNYYNYDDDD